MCRKSLINKRNFLSDAAIYIFEIFRRKSEKSQKRDNNYNWYSLIKSPQNLKHVFLCTAKRCNGQKNYVEMVVKYHTKKFQCLRNKVQIKNCLMIKPFKPRLKFCNENSLIVE